MDQLPTITGTILRDFLTCERLVWLEHHGDPMQKGSATPAVQARMDGGIVHEAAIHAAVAPDATAIPAASWEDAVENTLNLMRQGAAVILNAALESIAITGDGDEVILRGQVDRLERQVDGSYSPIEIKQHSSGPTQEDRIQLSYYCWLIERVMGAHGPGFFWLGTKVDDTPLLRLPFFPEEHALLDVLRNLLEVLSHTSAPAFSRKEHCRECPWRAFCFDQGLKQQHISLLCGIRKETVYALEAVGIVTVADFAPLAVEDIRAFRGIGPVTAPRLLANAQAWLSDSPVWYGNLDPDILIPGLFFDLETDPQGQSPMPWCFGWCDAKGQSRVVVVAPGRDQTDIELQGGKTITIVPSHEVGWRLVAEAALSVPGAVLHWTGYDRGIMEATAPDGVRQILASRMRDFHRDVVNAVMFPTSSTSIKAIAPSLGFQWGGYQDWFAALQDYQRWLHYDDEIALERACGYQEDDALAMLRVWRWLRENYPSNGQP